MAQRSNRAELVQNSFTALFRALSRSTPAARRGHGTRLTRERLIQRLILTDA
jgi:hypothetical protein